jgi:2-dehydro-3-deoxyphosphooctonate aldolase (KDO 8-P synthase)
VKPVALGDLSIGSGTLLLIAGPCVIESPGHALGLARAIRDIAARCGVQYIFKASYDKANRTSARSFRGPGLHDGLATLRRVRDEIGVPVLTDIHEPAHAAPAAEAADVLQIPAFLCRQTDLLVAAAQTGRVVKVKKGQFLAPWDMKNVVAKVVASGNPNVLLTERGSSFGYNTLVTDMRGLPIMAETGCPVIFDATHSVQQPGGQGTSSGGDRRYVPVLARAAVAVGVAGLFIETHEDPDRAPSDGPNMVPLKDFASLMSELIEIDALVKKQRSAAGGMRSL